MVSSPKGGVKRASGGDKPKRKRGPDKKPRKRRTDGKTNPPPKGARTGTRDPLPKGAVSAIQALKHRVPEGTPEVLANLAGEAFEAVVEVMRNPPAFVAFAKLSAARHVREEICGPMKQVIQHEGISGLAERLTEARRREIDLAKRGKRTDGHRG